MSALSVHLGVYPFVEKIETTEELTLGDLHGNTLKFIYILIKEGIVYFSKTNYHTFVHFYYSIPDLTHRSYRNLNWGYNVAAVDQQLIHQNHISVFEGLLEKITIKDNIKKLRLIGDVLADRGKCDYFTLKLLDKLFHIEGLKIETLLSNHDVHFFDFLNNNSITQWRATQQSLITLKEYLVKEKIVDDEDIKSIGRKYIDRLKLLSYTQIDELPPKLIIYTHAPIPFALIQALAEKLDVIYQDEDITALCTTIDSINQKFSSDEKYLQNAIYQIKNTGKDQLKTLEDEKISLHRMLENPYFTLTWCRIYLPLSYYQAPNSSYTLEFVHGHVGENPVPHQNITNLDNNLGKENQKEGIYLVKKTMKNRQFVDTEIDCLSIRV
jgi:hypothetical protein